MKLELYPYTFNTTNTNTTKWSLCEIDDFKGEIQKYPFIIQPARNKNLDTYLYNGLNSMGVKFDQTFYGYILIFESYENGKKIVDDFLIPTILAFRMGKFK